jgi:hypothetical protein
MTRLFNMKSKPIIAILLLQGLFTCVKAYAQLSMATATPSNCTTQIVTLTTASFSSGGQYPLSTNQIVTLDNVGSPAGFANAIVYFNYLNGGYTVYNSSGQTNIGLPITYTGLTGISLTNSAGELVYSVSATFTILTPSTNAITYTPANSVVIPTDAKGNVQIILQSSSDLVNWVSSMPGTYGSTYTNRFFRVIAVAQ